LTQIQRRARAKLLAIDAAKQLDDLRVPPGNRLEALHGDRKGQNSIRINDQWRICFVWRDGETWDVEIVDSLRSDAMSIKRDDIDNRKRWTSRTSRPAVGCLPCPSSKFFATSSYRR